MMIQYRRKIKGALAVLALCTGMASGQGLRMVNVTVDGGGHVSSIGGSLRLAGSLGQPDSGPALAGGLLVLKGGFWPNAGADVPDNDSCPNAIRLAIGSQFDGTTRNCGIDNDYPACGQGTEVIAPGAWFSVIGDGTRLKVDTCAGADFNTKINVYSGSCASPVCEGGNNNYCDLASQVVWSSAAGREYLVLVHGTLDESGVFTLTVGRDDGAIDCAAVDSLKATCRDGTLKVKAVLKARLPEGTIVHLTMDGTLTKTTTINARGKAKAVFSNAAPGAHEVCMDECVGLCSATSCNP